MTTPTPPDFEERNIFALAVLNRLDLDPQHIDLDTLAIHIGPDYRHTVTWDGHATLSTVDLIAIVEDVHAQVIDQATRHRN